MVLALVTSWEAASWPLKALHSDAGRAGGNERRGMVEAAVAGLVRPPTTMA